MKLYLEDFEAGIQSALMKVANGMFDLGGSAIFPRIENQAKWKFARTKDQLRLSDGANVYSFHLPHGEKHDQDFPAERVDDVSYNSFHEGVEGQGTAQIHRADPGSIYFTLQDGRSNPTYTLRHQGGKDWKAIPKRRDAKVAYVNEHEFMKGAGAMWDMSNSAVKGIANGADSLMNGVMSISKIPEISTPDWAHKLTGMGHIPSPMVAAGVGLGAGAVYDQAKRHIYNSDEENAEESGAQRLIGRYMLPAAGMAGIHSTQKSLWPNFSRMSPAFDR